MKPAATPTARALLTFEVVQGSPGITADRLADKLGVSERAARRYVAILREAGIPIESVRGPYGGYRVGSGLRLPPLVFTATEALGLVMAVLDGHHDAGDPTDPVGSALGKIVRALPEPAARRTRVSAAPSRCCLAMRSRVSSSQRGSSAAIAVRASSAMWPRFGRCARSRTVCSGVVTRHWPRSVIISSASSMSVSCVTK